MSPSPAACRLPLPLQEQKGGEDACFIADHCIGVADGVGGWAEIGVDPGLYSRQLMEFAKQATPSCQPGAQGAAGEGLAAAAGAADGGRSLVGGEKRVGKF